MKLLWTILDIHSDVYRNAQVLSKWLNTVFKEPKTLLHQNQDISALFTPDFSPKIYSTEMSWLFVKWKTEIICDFNSKYKFNLPQILLDLDKLCQLELVEQEEDGDRLIQIWTMKVAVDSSRKIMKELTLGYHPKQRDRTLVLFAPAGLSDESFDRHLKFINSGIKIFTNLIVLTLLPLVSSKSQELFKQRIENTLQSDLPVDYLFEQDNLKLGEVVLFHKLISDGNWNSKLREHIFYVHSKSNTLVKDSSLEASIELMYKFCFSNWDSMLAHPTAIQGGAIKSRFPFPTEPSPNWHYAGSFFWIKTSRLLADKERLILTDQFTIDKLPGFLDPFCRQSLVFLDTVHIPPCDINRANLTEFRTYISPFLTKRLPWPTVPSKYMERRRILESYKKSIKKSLN